MPSEPYPPLTETEIVDLTRRFWAKVNKTETCWLWTASKANGRGQIAIRRRLTIAPRVLWFLTFGVWPDPTLFVCHHCDVPACVRPDHLFVGTRQDNMIDCSRKGRNIAQTRPEAILRGEAHANAKLTTVQVLEIRRLRSEGVLSRALAQKYGISKRCINDIIARDTWKHL